MEEPMRLLKQLPLAKLEEMFKMFPLDLPILVSLQGELAHRKTPAAKQLLTVVNAKLKAAESKPASHPPKGTSGGTLSGKSAAEFKQGLTGPPVSKPMEAKAAPTLYPSAESAYARLRATFTEEGELTARWGMTPSLPPQLRTVLVEGWRGMLRKSATADGRTIADLEADLKRIDALQREGK